jgi:hypothetical protein
MSPTTGLIATSTTGDGRTVPFGKFGSGRFSPDGAWIAYEDQHGDHPVLYVEKFPERSTRLQVAGSGWEAVWRRDGKELLFAGQNRRLFAVDIRPVGGGIATGVPHELPISLTTSGGASFDVSADGKRILALVEEDSRQSDREITVLIHWREGLKPASNTR